MPLDKFDDWIQCSVPGIKADLTGEQGGGPARASGMQGEPRQRRGRCEGCVPRSAQHPWAANISFLPCSGALPLSTALMPPSCLPHACAAVNLTAADKAGSWYLTQGAVPAPAPAPAPVEVPAPAPAPESAPIAAPAPVVATPSPPVALAPPVVPTPPVGGASTVSAAVSAAAAVLGALLLAL